jgi:predicted Rdx family selenoprotein
LIEGDRGIFDVKADGTLVFSKHAQGRFPRSGEVVQGLPTVLT